MAQTGQKDLLARLADAGEEAIQRLAGSPGADRVLGVVNTMRDQLDALTKRVSGMDELERRIGKLERELAKLKAGGTSTSTRKTASAGKTTARKTGTARKSSSKTSSRSRSKRES